MAEKNLDFDTVIDRTHTNSLKYDFAVQRGKPKDVLPLWVADMDFQVSSYIQEALSGSVAHGIFGYSEAEGSYFEAVAGWMSRHYGWNVEETWLVKTPGIVFALAQAVRAFTEPGDAVLLQQPVYYPFSQVIRDNGRKIVDNTLVQGEDGRYRIDFADFEEKIRSCKVKLFFLCNPHNPAGRVWTRDELRRIGDICLRHNVIVVSDEIHCELTFPGFEYTPYATLGDDLSARCVCCNSPSKAFNTAGLQIANIVCRDPEMRRRIDRAINDNEVCDVNPFGVAALVAAYNEGEPWLAALVKYLHGNYRMAAERLTAELPGYTVTPLEGTYLLWLNVAPSGLDGETFAHRLEEQGRVMVSPGAIYGAPGEQFIRINLAAPRAVVADGIDRIVSFAKGLKG